jgi:hypothetical protein
MSQFVNESILPYELLSMILYKYKGLQSKSTICYKNYFENHNILEAKNKGNAMLLFEEIFYDNNKTIDRVDNFDENYRYSFQSNKLKDHNDQFHATFNVNYLDFKYNHHIFRIRVTHEEDYHLVNFNFYFFWNKNNNSCFLKNYLKRIHHVDKVIDIERDFVFIYLEDILPHMFYNIPTYDNGIN